MDNDLFDCDICYEQFTESGAHVPLVLPCGHTLCAQCVGSLRSTVCPTCKHPLQHPSAASAAAATSPTSPATSMIFPRNNWLIRCLLANQAGPKSQQQGQGQGPQKSVVVSRKKLPPGTAVTGQRVLFKQLDKACHRSRDTCPSDGGGYRCAVREESRGAALTAQEQKEKQQERLFLMNLSRICKEKRAQNSNFDQKRFVKEGLIMKFGEAKAKSILHEVFDRIRQLRAGARKA